MQKSTIFLLFITLIFFGCGDEKQAKKEGGEQIPTENLHASIQRGGIEITASDATVIVNKNPAILYQRCAACHGNDGSQRALGKSKPIKGHSKESLLKMLKGYRDGAFGGEMRQVMTNQVKYLSDKDIEILAEYISRF